MAVWRALITRRWLAPGLVLLGLLPLAACDRAAAPGAQGPARQAAFKGVDITGAEYAQALSLTDPQGQRRSLAEFRGRVVVVFFGFTHCPDVCPTTLIELASVKQQLGADGERIQGIFVTVDPERDTPALLKAYVDNFGAGFLALRGTEAETREAARHFKVFFNKVPGQTASSYTIDHTAGSYVFDTQGRIRLFTRHGAGAEALRHDLQLLLSEAGPQGSPR